MHLADALRFDEMDAAFEAALAVDDAGDFGGLEYEPTVNFGGREIGRGIVNFAVAFGDSGEDDCFLFGLGESGRRPAWLLSRVFWVIARRMRAS